MTFNPKGPGDIGAKLFELDDLVGRSRIALPGEDATPEAVQSFYHAIGVPKDAKDYGDFKFDNVEPDANMVNFAREIFPKAGVTKKGAETIVRSWNGMMAKVVGDHQKAVEAKLQQGEEAFAAAQGGKAAASLDIVNRASQALGVAPEALKAIKGAIGAKEANELFLKIGHAIATDGDDPEGGGITLQITTKTQAQAELDKMKADPNIAAAIRDPNHKEHKAAKAKWDRLTDIKAGFDSSRR